MQVETVGPASTGRSLPHQTGKSNAGPETPSQAPERSRLRGPPPRRGSSLGEEQGASGWQQAPVPGRQTSRGQLGWPPGAEGCSNLVHDQRLSRALGLPPASHLPPTPTSAREGPREDGTGLHHHLSPADTRVFPRVTSSSTYPNPPSDLPWNRCPSEWQQPENWDWFLLPRTLPSPMCQLYLLSLPWGLLFLSCSAILLHMLPATLFPALSTPCSHGPRAFALAVALPSRSWC